MNSFPITVTPQQPDTESPIYPTLYWQIWSELAGGVQQNLRSNRRSVKIIEELTYVELDDRSAMVRHFKELEKWLSGKEDTKRLNLV